MCEVAVCDAQLAETDTWYRDCPFDHVYKHCCSCRCFIAWETWMFQEIRALAGSSVVWDNWTARSEWTPKLSIDAGYRSDNDNTIPAVLSDLLTCSLSYLLHGAESFL